VIYPKPDADFHNKLRINILNLLARQVSLDFSPTISSHLVGLNGLNGLWVSGVEGRSLGPLKIA